MRLKSMTMAKLYAEMTSHSNKRVLKRGDDTRILVDVYHKNTKIGTLGVYQIHATDGYRVIWDNEKGQIETVQEFKTS